MRTDEELRPHQFSGVSSQLDAPSNTYILPWQIRLQASQMRPDETGSTSAKVFPITGNWNDDRQIGLVPFCAKQIPQYIESARLKETQALLKFGRDNQWPIRMSVITSIGQESSGMTKKSQLLGAGPNSWEKQRQNK
jgi:hypothetical protein